MRLGGPVFLDNVTPEGWIAELKRLGYRAAYAPVNTASSAAERSEYAQAAAEADIVIAEVGAWSNPLSPDKQEADTAYRGIVSAIRLADDLGARCCVNIAGSCGSKWDGPDPEDMTPGTFDRIVALSRRLLKEADPRKAFYTLEGMPWMYPDSAESYRALLVAINHPRFGVHYDPVNLVNSPAKYFRTGDEIRKFVGLLGDQIVSVHAKDIVLGNQLTTHLDETIPGDGGLDYDTLLTELGRLDDDLPVMTEHLSTPEEYEQAANHIRKVSARLGHKL